MFRYLKKELITSMIASLTLLSDLILPAIAVDLQPVYAQSAPPSLTKPANWYKQAEAELPQDAYLIYRIVDRLARANHLDIPYWRVTIGSEYSAYAYAEGTPYLIVLSKGILDITEGDSSALAHIIAHEMAHHVHQDSAKISKIQEELIEKMQEAMSQSENVEGVMSQIIQQQLDMQQQIEKQVQAIELAAHETGYSYAVRAGFDTEGGLRAMRLFTQLSETTNKEEIDPELSEIIELLEALPTKYPPETLQQEGNTWLYLTKPLTYQFSKDEQSLRVNTKPTVSSLEDFHRRFGQ